ncbi:MAG: hypothetical protein Q7S48_04410 [bacterium]|nr:hypothetical protein [bacterium]
MSQDRGGQSRRGEGDTELIRLDALKSEQRRELTRNLNKKLYKGGNSEEAKKIGAQFEELGQPEDAAIAYHIAFNLGERTREVILKVVQNYAASEQYNELGGFFEEVQEKAKDKALGIKDEWIERARAFIPYSGRAHEIPVSEKAKKKEMVNPDTIPKKFSQYSRTKKHKKTGYNEEGLDEDYKYGSKHVYVTDKDEASLREEVLYSRAGIVTDPEDLERQEREREDISEVIPAGAYIIRLTHFRKNSKRGSTDPERIYADEAKPIGSILVGANVTTINGFTHRIRGITLPKLLYKARGALSLTLKGLAEGKGELREPAGNILVEILDSRNERVVGSFDEEINKKGMLKSIKEREEVVTEEQLDVVLGSYGIDLNKKEEPEAFIARKREEMMKGVKKIEAHIDSLNQGDCKNALRALGRETGGEPFEGMREVKALEQVVNRTEIAKLSTTLRALLETQKEEKEIGSLTKRIEDLREGIADIIVDAEHWTSPYRLSGLLIARKKALEATKKLEKQKIDKKKAAAERFDEGKEKELLEILKTTGFIEPTEREKADNFIELKLQEFELIAVPRIRKLIESATTSQELNRILGKPDEQNGSEISTDENTIFGIKDWYVTIRATVSELQNAIRAFKPGPDSPKERIETWVTVLSELKNAIDAREAEVEKLSMQLHNEVKVKMDEFARKKGEELMERMDRPFGPDEREYVSRIGDVRRLAKEADASSMARLERAPEPEAELEAEQDYEIESLAVLTPRIIRYFSNGAKTVADVRANIEKNRSECLEELKEEGISEKKKEWLENDLKGLNEALLVLNDPARAPQMLRGIIAEIQDRIGELKPEWEKVDNKDERQEIWRLNALVRKGQRLNKKDRASLKNLRDQHDLWDEFDLLAIEKRSLLKLLGEVYGEFEKTPEATHQRYAENTELVVLLYGLEYPALKDSVVSYIKRFPKENSWSEERKEAFREIIKVVFPRLDFSVCRKFDFNRLGLDSRSALYLMSLAGIEIPRNKITPVLPGEPREGTVNINVGGEEGVATPLANTPYLRNLLKRGVIPDTKQFPRHSRSLYFDHHSGKSASDTSSTKNMYETLAYLGFFEEKDREAIENAVKLVTLEDNKSHPAWRDSESAWRKGNWRKTMLGLVARLPFGTIVEYAEDHPGTDFTAELKDAEIKKYKLKSTVNAVEATFKQAKKEWEELQKDGYSEYGGGGGVENDKFLLKVSNSKFGEMTVVFCRDGGFPGSLDAIRALGGDKTIYIVYNPSQKTFFASHTDKEIPEGLFREGMKLRERMWVYRGKESEQYPFTLRNVMTQMGVDSEALKANPKLEEAIVREEEKDSERKEIERVYDVVGTYLGETLGYFRGKFVTDKDIKDPDEILQEKLGYQLYALLKGDTELWHDYKTGKEESRDPDIGFLKELKDQYGEKLEAWIMKKANIADGSPDEIEDRLSNIFGSAWSDVQMLIHTPKSA